MEQINEREIPNFFDLENSLKADGKVDMTTFMQFLKSKGNLEAQDPTALYLRALQRPRPCFAGRNGLYGILGDTSGK